MGVPPDPGFEMTANRKKKLSARDLAAGTGLSYTVALRSLDSRQVPGPGDDRPAPPVPPGLIEARHAGRCGYCGRKISQGARIAAHREHWGHARCVGSMRPDVRSWLEERAREHPTVEIPLRIAAGYEASGDEQSARRCRADAEAATRKLVAPFRPVPPDLEELVRQRGAPACPLFLPAVRSRPRCRPRSRAHRGGRPLPPATRPGLRSRHDPEHAHR
jgi:hypothetical protein